MTRGSEALDLLFGIGFKVGFLITIVGMFMMYMPLISHAVDPLLHQIGFWEAFRANPYWFQVFFGGLVLMAFVILINVVRGWVEEMVDILFGKTE